MWPSSVRAVAALVVLAAGAALGIAIGSERWGGLVPCALCLLERWPYRVAVGLGIVALVIPARGGARVLLTMAVLALLADVVLAGIHVGVEQHAWPSPLPECAAPHLSGSIAQRLAEMPARPGKPCDAPTFLIRGVPLSMAAMDLIYALVLALALAAYLWGTRERRP